jgi:lipid A 4'-phosphatase
VKPVAIWLALVAAAAALFLLFPGIDLWTSGLFWRPGQGFFLQDNPAVRAIYLGVPYLTHAIVVFVLLAFLWWLARRRPLLGLGRRKMAFLVLALALGPGLVVNVVLKDHWGRARPSQVTEFGGEKRFTPAPLPADQCRRNCSFAGGHAAMGFYLLAFAFLVRDRRRRRIAVAASVAAGALIGLARISQGGHFLSDIVFAGLLVWGVTWLLHLWIVERNGAAQLGRLLRHAHAAAPASARLGIWAVAVAAAITICVLYVDRPLTIWMKQQSDQVHAVFAFITKFGVSTGYLIGAASLFAALRLAARVPRLAGRRERLVAWSYLPAFVFTAMAASGLTVDLLKTVIGRSRPKLLFLPGETYSFGFFATGADNWSFPSGHTANATSLALALSILWPRLTPAFIAFAVLIAASRIIISAHYLSDVIGGAFVAVLMTSYVARVFARSGIDLALAKEGRLGPPGRPPWRVRLGVSRRTASDSP